MLRATSFGPLLTTFALACSTPEPALPTPATAADSARVLQRALATQVGTTADSLEVLPGARIRLVYVTTAAPGVQATSLPKADYSADSARYRAAFDQAAWLWTRRGERAGVDTIIVEYVTLIHNSTDPLQMVRYMFYPSELRHPTKPPLLDRS